MGLNAFSTENNWFDSHSSLGCTCLWRPLTPCLRLICCQVEKPTSTFKPVIKPAIKVKPKSAASDSAPSVHGAAPGKRKEDEAVSGPESKKAKVDEEDNAGGGLAGLLGAYGSSGDDDA